LATYVGGQSKSVKRAEVAARVAKEIVRAADDPRRQSDNSGKRTDELIDKAEEKAKEMAEEKILDKLKEKAGKEVAQELMAAETGILRGLGFDDPAAAAKELNSVVGGAVTAVRLYVHLLEVAAAVEFTGGQGRLWYQPSPPSSTDKTFLMAVFVGYGLQPQMGASASTTSTSPVNALSRPSSTAQPPSAPGAVGSAFLGQSVIGKTLAQPAPARETPSTPRALSPADLYGKAWFYWDTP
jgi:hypothetical protein